MPEEIEIEAGNDEFLAMLNHAREDLGAVEQPLAAWVTAEPPQPSMWEQAADYFIDKMVPEVGDMLAQKWQEGANEIAKALYGQADGFVLYGHSTMKATEMPESDFDGMLYEASLRAMPEQEQQMER
jgi:hypothetical protein